MNLRQHQSHKDLLTNVEADGAPRAALDAIIVPNGRTAPYLRQAIAAAKENDVFLLVLCSMLGDASSAALEAKRAGVRVAAINIDEVPTDLVPAFATDRLLLDCRFHRRVDTSLKRNLGLLIARLAGWERILFLDDDIVLPDPTDVAAAAGLLDEHAVVGLANSGMPDNSVVCHALRDIGAAQETFIGGGALVVGEAAFGSFFPNIYNEDWFFLLDGLRLRPSAITGTAIQHPYDPYRDARRARGEELGDTLAEGVYGLLDNGGGLEDADERYWREFLPDRRRIIQSTIDLVRTAEVGEAQKARMVACLKAAIGRSHLITPELCVRYLRAWQTDGVQWRTHLGRHPRGIGIEAALATLRIDTVAQPGPGGRISSAGKRRSSGTPAAARG
jgi:glycosyltransferase involved in cell wall biosynthesis